MKIQHYNAVNDMAVYASHIHTLNHRWWHDASGNRFIRSHPQMLALMMSEASEALEGLRKGLRDDHIPAYPMDAVEMTDVVIRLLDWAGALSLPVIYNGSITIETEPSNTIWLIMREIVRLETTPIVDLSREVCYIIALCEGYVNELYPQFNFWDILHDKLIYNSERKDHKHEARAAEGGKKF